jgi:hypothetical protein
MMYLNHIVITKRSSLHNRYTYTVGEIVGDVTPIRRSYIIGAGLTFYNCVEHVMEYID